MITEYVKKTNIGVGIGILLEIGGRVIITTATPPSALTSIVGALLVIVGAVMFVWGCFNYSQAKGYSPFLGFLGLLSCLGLVILVVLPDKCKDGNL